MGKKVLMKTKSRKNFATGTFNFSTSIRCRFSTLNFATLFRHPIWEHWKINVQSTSKYQGHSTFFIVEKTLKWRRCFNAISIVFRCQKVLKNVLLQRLISTLFQRFFNVEKNFLISTAKKLWNFDVYLKAWSHEYRISLRMGNECHFLASVNIRFMHVWSSE